MKRWHGIVLGRFLLIAAGTWRAACDSSPADPENRPPIAKISAYKTAGPEPLPLAFSSDGSADPEGSPVRFEWRLQPEGKLLGKTEEVGVTLEIPGNYVVELRVFDDEDRFGTASLPITVGNTPPEVRFIEPQSGDFFTPGKPLRYKLEVIDPEDGATAEREDPFSDRTSLKAVWYRRDRREQKVDYNLSRGLSGEITPPEDPEIAAAVLEASYTDAGRPPAAPLTGKSVVRLRNRRLQAELADETHGAQVLGRFLGAIDHGGYVRFAAVNLSDSSSVSFRVASGSAGGVIELRAASTDGPLLARAEVQPTGGWDQWTEIRTPFKRNANGRRDVYVVFVNPGKSGLMSLDWIRFNEN